MCGFAEQVRARYGVALIAVHCAALQFMSAVRGAEQRSSWRATHAVNVLGGFHLAKAFLPGMKARALGAHRHGGLIELLRAAAAHDALHLEQGRLSAWCADWQPRLGNSELPSMRWHRDSRAPATRSPACRRRISTMSGIIKPIKRSGEPEDQAAAMSFMVSDDAGFMSGQTMLVDGGEGHVCGTSRNGDICCSFWRVRGRHTYN
jgi:NAD(P)-dependent dehydrogenase (short-subunit alcohol dehydrogenase family)